MKKVALVVIIFISLPFSFAHAAEMSFATPDTCSIGDTFEAPLILSTDDQSINAVGATLTYSSDLFELEDIRTEDSVFPLWIEVPHEDTPGEISFAGGVPHGFAGTGTLFTVVFKVRASGIATSSISDAEAYINDGIATSATVSFESHPVFSFKR